MTLLSSGHRCDYCYGSGRDLKDEGRCHRCLGTGKELSEIGREFVRFLEDHYTLTPKTD